MRTLAHLSDLHFGREDPRIIEALLHSLETAAPDLIVISGDLTQRARESEFRRARAFLERLPAPFLVLPGNHDVPLYNLVRRCLRPLGRYRRMIPCAEDSFYADEEVAVVGVNTARSLTFKNGRVNPRQIEEGCRRLQALPAAVIKVVATHHPLSLPAHRKPQERAGRAELALSGFSACHVDLYLSGHLHISYAGPAARTAENGYVAVVAHAGTAVSTRSRGEANAWNLIRLEPSAMVIEPMGWTATSHHFAALGHERFRRHPWGWDRHG